MKANIIKIFITIIAVVTCCIILLTGCDQIIHVQYNAEAKYMVVSVDEYNAKVYKPSDASASRGIIFYVGTAMQPSAYENLANLLAEAGYYVALPNVGGNLAYFGFKDKEQVMDKLPEIKFVVGGHSQGGGAAAKRLAQSTYNHQTMGGIFLSPLFFKDSDLSQLDKSALLIEAEFDKILSTTMKEDARAMMPKDVTAHMISGGNHMGYSNQSIGFDGTMTISEQEQQEITAKYILEYLNKINW